MHRALGSHARVQFDLTECRFVAGDVLLQKAEQGFGLLRAQIDALKIADFHVSLGLLLQCAEDEKKVPDIDAHLHAIGITLAVGGIVG